MSEENLDISVDELLKEINVIDPRIIALALERMRSRQLQMELDELKGLSHG